MNFSTAQTVLDSALADIAPLDEAALNQARALQAKLAKPPGSLGKLESLSVQIAGITGSVHNTLKNKHLLVFAADNGVAEEGVSSAPQSVTLMQSVNLTKMKTGASVLAHHFGCSLTVCDVGINADVHTPDILDRKIAFGTQNIAHGPAMTRDQALLAVSHGITLARETAEKADVIGIGEMGIGNTTTASAVLSVLSGLDAEAVTGRGGGLWDDAFQNKKRIIRESISLNAPDKNDPIDVLSKVGGFDLAAMCGAYLGAAVARTPVVIDGFPSAVSALAAYRLCPAAREYFIPSHASEERGFAVAIELLGLSPALLLNMRLGEGSGCPIMFEILSAACAVINNMATFEGAGIDSAYIDELVKESYT